MYYLAEHRGWRDPVVVSVNNTSMAARLGEHYGIKTYETPVGFKFIGPKMIETGAMMGAEESGGFGFGMHLPERDGVYADLLLLDLFLRERAAGRWPVSSAIAQFHELAGPSWYLRVDVHVERADRTPRRSGACSSTSRRRRRVELAGEAVARTVPLDTGDGFKFFLADGSWLLIRASGTEPLVRVYTEATSAELRDALLVAGERPGARLVSDSDAGGGRRVEKPWGHELIWAHTERYVGKILVIEAGKRLSLQRHEVKDESILVLSGRLRLYLEDDDGRGPRRGARTRRAPARPDRPDPPLRGDRALRADRGLDARARRRRPPRGRLRARRDQRPVGGSGGDPGSWPGVLFGHATAITGRGA